MRRTRKASHAWWTSASRADISQRSAKCVRASGLRLQRCWARRIRSVGQLRVGLQFLTWTVESKCVAPSNSPAHQLTQEKIEASMCHLRGLLMLKLNRGDQAKNCFMEALALDVKCYEAFEQLISGEMMTPIEGAVYEHYVKFMDWSQLCRVGVRAVSGVQEANTSRRRVRTDDVHLTLAEV